ncbi:DUF7346 family protein [Natrarchaeobius oligotrophus]|uniref:Uncharacterized protein n=1 Tax=Natrarchaeobius chitinivorans TaxID=1679083 RepID=A0A3N6MQ09_NATCH|nr:hypothetical protein [Natrarchaeobius chitinivorans]RQG99710.1 hypothetical protein EA472_13735 [Natrarchaeobius chitinivorans]
MKTVQDDTGKRYLLLKRSEHASLVRDPQSGNECYVQNDRLESVDESSALETAARTVSSPLRTLLTTVHDERTLGLLVELDERGPLSVRSLLDAYDFCESDLHGRLTVLTSAGLLEETDVDGERGYRLAEPCRTALEAIRTSAVPDEPPSAETTSDVESQ